MALGSLNQTEIIKLARKKLKHLKNDKMPPIVEWKS
jgi:hypothetical protein